MAQELVYFDTANPGQTNLYTYLLGQGNLVKASDGSLISPLNLANLALAKIALIDTGHAGVYTGDVPAAAVAGLYNWVVLQQAGGAPAFSDVTISDKYRINWNGTTEALVATLLVSAAGSAGPGNGATVNTDFLNVLGSIQWQQQLTALGLDTTGWQTFALTLKADPDADADDEALLTVRVTNGGSVSDGLITFNRAPAVDKTQASLTVNAFSPNTQVTWLIKAPVMDLPPSSANQNYTWELDVWIAGARLCVGKGAVQLIRSARRLATSP